MFSSVILKDAGRYRLLNCLGTSQLKSGIRTLSATTALNMMTATTLMTTLNLHYVDIMSPIIANEQKITLTNANCFRFIAIL